MTTDDDKRRQKNSGRNRGGSTAWPEKRREMTINDDKNKKNSAGIFMDQGLGRKDMDANDDLGTISATAGGVSPAVCRRPPNP
jgi:hypothetical protein